MKYHPASAEPLLRRTPSVVRALLSDLPSAWLDAPERPGAWSAREVACHMADLEQDAWLPRLRWILAHGSAEPMPGVDRERFRVRYADAPLETVLDDFASLRQSNLQALDELDLDAGTLQQTGRHETLGEVRLAHLMSAWLVHDLTHLAQIERALAAQYRQEVGPWAEFLSILAPRSQR